MIFLDTEFTDLALDPRLLSVGLVDDQSHREFYAEVTDADRLQAASWFVKAVVLPQFGKVAHAACSYAVLGTRLATCLGGLTASLDPGALLDVVFDCPLDWTLVDRALRDAGDSQWASTSRRIRPVNVHALTGFGAGKRAAAAYFKSQELAPFWHHHALCDARALRLAYRDASAASLTAA